MLPQAGSRLISSLGYVFVSDRSCTTQVTAKTTAGTTYMHYSSGSLPNAVFESGM